MEYGRLVEFGEGNFYHEINGYVNGEKQILYVKQKTDVPKFLNGEKIE